MLVNELEILPQNTFTLYAAFQKIYIIINYDKYRQHLKAENRL